jgi:hypothetical protein
MLLTMVLAIALIEDRPFEADQRQYSIWLQQACRIQQADRNPGQSPAMYESFCECFSRDLRETSTPEAYRVMSLSLQGNAEGRGEIKEWEVARDTAFAEYEALPEEEKSALPARLQSGLLNCISLTPQTAD